MEYALALVVLGALVAAFVLWPLRARGEAGERAATGAPDATAAAADVAERRAELEVARDVKLREIRDAELDLRMGKLSDEDFRRTDAELRAQALEIVRELDRLGDRGR